MENQPGKPGRLLFRSTYSLNFPFMASTASCALSSSLFLVSSAKMFGNSNFMFDGCGCGIELDVSRGRSANVFKIKCFVFVVPVSHKRFYRHPSSLRNVCICPYMFCPMRFAFAPPPPALYIFLADSFPHRVLSFPLKLWMWPHCRAVRSPVEPISSRNSAKRHAIVDCPFDKLDTIASTWFDVHNFTFPQWYLSWSKTRNFSMKNCSKQVHKSKKKMFIECSCVKSGPVEVMEFADGTSK